MKSRVVRVVLLCLAAVFVVVAGGHQWIQGDSAAPQAAAPEKYEFDYTGVKAGPPLNLKSAILINHDNGKVLYAKNAAEVRPIASLSKLVTAMVVLDRVPDLGAIAVVTRDDAYQSSRSRLPVGTKMTMLDLLHAMLLCSDNRAARVLARATYGSIEAFAHQMNLKVRALGLENTHFVEPTGLDEHNVSTAEEVAKILHFACDYPAITEITRKKIHILHPLNRANARMQIRNTNRLLWSSWRVLAGKTGYIDASAYCLTTLVGNGKEQHLSLVVLGAPGDRTRFKEARRLLNWGFKNLS